MTYYYVCDDEGIVVEYEKYEEAEAYIEAQGEAGEDMWITSDEYDEPDDIDSDFGFDAYCGCYTYDC